MRYLLDSNAINDYIQRKHQVFQRARTELLRGNTIGTTIPVLAEFIAGIEVSQNREKNFSKLAIALEQLRVWPFDQVAAYVYGKLFAELRLLGTPIGVIDVMIASVALTLRPCTVVTIDSDFSKVPGLSVENWRI